MNRRLNAWTFTEAAQVIWLQQGYRLEFLGTPSFVPGLWASSILLFIVNIWILGITLEDVATVNNPANHIFAAPKIQWPPQGAIYRTRIIETRYLKQTLAKVDRKQRSNLFEGYSMFP